MNQLRAKVEARIRRLKEEAEAKKPPPPPRPPRRHERPMIAMHADQLRQIRAELGYTQAAMAKRLRVSLRNYKRHEQTGIPGRARLRADTVRRMRAAAKGKGTTA